ncbi:MAG: Na+/H+ antiporter NhaA [Gordonibacter sp.]
MPTERILEPEVRHHHRRKRKLREFTHSSTWATMLMLATAVLAQVIENTPILPSFAEFWHTFSLGFSVGDFAFFNAGILLAGMDLVAVITNPVTAGVFLGLLFGKPLGIFLATWLTVRSRLPQARPAKTG